MLSIFSLLISILLGVMNPAGHNPASVPSPRTQNLADSKSRVMKAFNTLPMRFEINRGQSDSAVRFLARGQGYTLFLNPSEAVLALQSTQPDSKSPEKLKGRPNPTTRLLRMRVEGANLSAPATGLHQLPGISNYFIGKDPRRWRTNIPTYEKVQFENVRPGVNLVYYGTHGQLEYDFVLSPGVKPESVMLGFEGSGATVDRQGNLVFASTDGKMIFRRPVAYQQGSSEKEKQHFVKASYVLKGRNRVGFNVSGYDPREPLIIDPVLNYSTFLGGNGGDQGNAIAVDEYNDAYVTGSTASANFPISKGYQNSYKGETDAFVTKLRYDGEVVLYSTYLGGSNYDAGLGIALDSSRYAYITGNTYSSDFPTTANAFQTSPGGGSDAFVTKLDVSGSTLIYSSYLGGSGDDFGYGIAVSTTGNAYVTGSTQSTNFPTVNAIQGGNNGNIDAFVARVNPVGTALVFSTYLGGSAADVGQGIATDVGGNAYVVGYTYSKGFPTYNPYQAANAGTANAFITELSADGLSFLFSSYLGGNGLDRGLAIALDSNANIYVTGDTTNSCQPATTTTTLCSPNVNFPVTAGAYQTVTNSQSPGYSDVFVTKLLSPGYTYLGYSTLLGGTLTDSPAGIAVDAAGDAYVTGYTISSDFPTANAVQASFSGGTCGTGATPCPDAFVTEFNPTGTSVVYSTYLGGTAQDYGTGIAVDSNADAYVVGTTLSPDFPSIAGAEQGSPGGTIGLSNAFVAEIAPSNLAGVALTPQTLAFGNEYQYTASAPMIITLRNMGTVPLNVSSISLSGDFSETDNCVGTIAAGGGKCTISVIFTPQELIAETYHLYVYDDAEGSPHSVTLTGTGITATTQVTFTPINLVFPAQTINTTSASQSVTMQNTGIEPVTITAISTGGDFAETNNCPTDPATLGINAICTITVTFTPTATGTRSGSVTVTDNVSSGKSFIGLTGTGNPVYSLATSSISQTLPIGKTYTTFLISVASSNTNFVNNQDEVALTCEAGPSCAFSMSPIYVGQTSTLTVSGLNANSNNPDSIIVDGTYASTSGAQKAQLYLTLYFQDYTLSASPSLSSVTAGNSVLYSIFVSPINGFNQPVLLTCASNSIPANATCTFSPAAISPTGTGTAQGQLEVTTQQQSTAQSGLLPKGRRHIPPGPMIMLVLWGVSILAMLIVLLARRKMGRRGTEKRRRFIYAQVAFATLVLAITFWMSCDTSIYSNVLKPASTNGTPTGNYTIVVDGTFNGSDSPVTRTVSVNLTVQ